MKPGGTIWGTAALVAMVGLGLGLAHLFRLRFEAGDVYPPYSSLRADPLGVRGLYDSFAESTRHRVTRNFRPLGGLRGASDPTVFWLGVGRDTWLGSSEEGLKAAEEVVRTGGRLVLGFAGSRMALGAGSFAPGGTNAPAPPGGAGGRVGATPPVVAVMQRWGFSLREIEQGTTAQGSTAELADGVASETGLRTRIPWPSSMTLQGLSDRWRTVYAVKAGAVVVERGLGKGSIVLCADSYLFSNEALRKEPQAAFLLWAAGDGAQLVFDETHLGVEEQVGVATLGRRYRLHGLMIGLFVLSAMWVWRARFPLVPACGNEEPDRRGEVMMGRDAASGLSALLRRHVSSADLLGACVGEWRRSFPAEVRRLGVRADELTTVVVRERDLRPRERRARQAMAYGELRDLVEPPHPRRRSEAKPRRSKEL